jgi:hypothetical protein
MTSATGQIIRPIDQDVLPFVFNAGSGKLVVQCRHTPDFVPSIFLPAEMSDHLDYESYTLSCDRVHLASSIRFSKQGAPGITIHGTYRNCLPHIPLSSVPLHYVKWIGPCRTMYVPTELIDATPLSLDISTAMNQVLLVCSLFNCRVPPSNC